MLSTPPPNAIVGCSACKTDHKSQGGLEPGDFCRKKEGRRGKEGGSGGGKKRAIWGGGGGSAL